MLFRSYKPHRPLSNFIETLWVYSGFESPRLKELIFPSGTFELVFNLRDNMIRIYKDAASDEFQCYSGAIASGPYAGPFVTDTALEASVMGVHFKPGGAFPFLGPPADELRDRHIDLEMIWGHAAANVLEQLRETPSLGSRFRLLERFLLSRLVHPLQHHGAVAEALTILDRSRWQMTRELARSAGLSEKRFIDVFRSEVGLNPRLFTRICRFQRVLAGVQGPSPTRWAQVAATEGYFDQSHLIRDFLTFSGFGPAEYLRRVDDLLRQGLLAKFNHLPLAR
jgi:AraC-like DNA-binding protein